MNFDHPARLELAEPRRRSRSDVDMSTAHRRQWYEIDVVLGLGPRSRAWKLANAALYGTRRTPHTAEHCHGGSKRQPPMLWLTKVSTFSRRTPPMPWSTTKRVRPARLSPVGCTIHWQGMTMLCVVSIDAVAEVSPI